MLNFEHWPTRWIDIPRPSGGKSEIGYSFSDFLDPDWHIPDKARIVEYMNSFPFKDAVIVPPRKCDLCEFVIDPSCAYYFDGTWYWSEYERHYFESHDVRLPDEFISDVRALQYIPLEDEEIDYEIAENIRTAIYYHMTQQQSTDFFKRPGQVYPAKIVTLSDLEPAPVTRPVRKKIPKRKWLNFDSWPTRWISIPSPSVGISPFGYSFSDFQDRDWIIGDKFLILRYMKSLPFPNVVLGPKKCDICEAVIDPSHAFFWDGTWYWSDIEIHYFEQHDVRLPEEFLWHVRKRRYVPPKLEEIDYQRAKEVNNDLDLHASQERSTNFFE